MRKTSPNKPLLVHRSDQTVTSCSAPLAATRECLVLKYVYTKRRIIMKKKDLSGQKAPSNSKKKREYWKYSYGLKRKVVYEIESGYLSLEEARVLNGIKSKSIIIQNKYLLSQARISYFPSNTAFDILMTYCPLDASLYGNVNVAFPLLARALRYLK